MHADPSLHPTDAALRDYGLGKLDAVAAQATHRHLEACDRCRGRVAEQSADSFLDRFRDFRPGESRAPGAPPSADTLPPGLADHPDYEIQRELGRGGMGVVYLAHNRLMGRDEVLKVMSEEIVSRPGVRDRFLREMRAVARLRHPNIVAGYSALRVGESLAFAMEYVPGLDLARMVKIKGPLPVAHACRFAHQAALGLQHAHEAGLIHRDVKPSNLILSHDAGRAAVKVLDFGLTKGGGEAPEEHDGGLTQSGQALGTPDYIAPEQILDAMSVDIRADVYSLGATLFFLLAGRPPFRAKSLYDLYQAHISRLPDPMDQIRPDVPAELAALVAKMMAKDPDERFQTPKEAAQALAPFFKGRSAATDLSVPGPALPASTIGDATGSLSTPAAPRARTIAAASTPAGPETEAAATSGGRRGLVATAGFGALLGLLAIAGLLGVFRARTSEGTLVLRNLPEDAQVSIDGERYAFTWPGLDQPLEIRAVPGEKRLEVTKGGFTAFATDLSLKAGGREEVSIRLEPIAATGPVATDSATAAVGDLLKVGSVWEGPQVVETPINRRVQMKLRIESRREDAFEGVVSYANGWSGLASGTISADGAMRWGFTRVVTWAKDQTEERKRAGLAALPGFRAVGAVSASDRTIRGEFKLPGQAEGDLEGTFRLTLAEAGEAAPVAAPAPIVAVAPGDLLKVGSVWKGPHVTETPVSRQLEVTLKINARRGDEFEGVASFPNDWSAAVRGTISEGGGIRWGYTRVITWANGQPEDRKRIALASLPNFKATGTLSVPDRTIRCDFVRPGHPEGDLKGTLRLTLAEEGEPTASAPENGQAGEAAESTPTPAAETPTEAVSPNIAAPETPPQAEEPRKAAADPNAGFVPIFNGRDLTGWQFGPTRNRKWVVERGELIGDGDNGNDALLATVRDDYADVHVKMKVLRGANRGQVFVRWAWDGGGYYGYGVAIGLGKQVAPGSICKAENWPLKLAKPLWMARSGVTPSADNPWYELEIVAKGATITTYIDGEKAAEYNDEKVSFARGNILLYARAGAQFRFKDIEVKVPAPSEPPPRGGKRPAASLDVDGLLKPGSVWRGEQDLKKPTTRTRDMA